ncbi:hypothetical protein K2173_011779 [Erythroxylum novogranatense]|uniref:Uncharacterized protein n=1 Tax=Erythroxylum novogranatense TaxID=1862640 RepID=A0AAV8U9Q2_9ROSI|nr:hypothetical protein K2173_011779 [Erythroxylum novogranatense]
MRGSTIPRKIPGSNSFISKHYCPFFSSSFSTSSGRGGGGNRDGNTAYPFSPGQFGRRSLEKADSDEPRHELPPRGRGHGGGTPLPSDNIDAAFSSFISSIKPVVGRGRGSTSAPLSRPTESVPTTTTQFSQPHESKLTLSVLSKLNGTGRGKAVKEAAAELKSVEENRHIRKGRPRRSAVAEGGGGSDPKMSREESLERAMSILSRSGEDRGGGGEGWRREREEDNEVDDDDNDDYGGLVLGDNKDGERFADKLGVENMNKLIEGFEEMSNRILPSPMDDASWTPLIPILRLLLFLPYIDEKKEIMPIRAVLEKVKPFMMRYEGFKEAVEEVMKNAPLLKEIVDYYSGPDRITAKSQQEELERVAKTIPASAPSSVKKFTDHAVLSLQSNPGWGFDKKCQFMEKLVKEVNQLYK